jgi:5-methyltetrahydropteroyltriglutamate--homocysteine methyltransferase
MLTGPVTIANWSYRPPGIPDERLFWAVARAVAAEVGHLIAAGARVIQIDEPAVRERWPLRTPGWDSRRERYREGARRALQLVFHQPPDIQMHTHMCYSEFGDIVGVWRGVDVDVGAIEFTRSDDPSYLVAFAALGWDIGPGVFDVHSPHRPGSEPVAGRLRRALDLIPPERLWVNPDCGLKTRAWEEVEGQVADMLAGAEEVRSHAPVRA